MKPRAHGAAPNRRPERPTTRILLVDDHPLMRKGLRALLESEPGFAVIGEAGDGTEALEQVRAMAPHVVVMDVSMPGMTGMEATGRILTEFPGTRVVTLSMYGEKTFVDDMLKAGAAAYVLKDSAPEDLVQAIHAALRGECFLSPPILGTVVSGYRESVSGSAPPPFILQTKLHRPALPVDLVPRTMLLDRLEAGRALPLTLVSAPAGYGKSMLIASWLDRATCPSAWVALDHDDSDIRQFVTYIVAALHRLFPDACEESLSLAKAAARPPVAALAAALSNELHGLEHPVILVLDDYHHIKVDSPVNELLQQLLTRPPGHLHLVVVTRRDPPIQLSLLRSRGQVNEIRMRDLRFDGNESRALLDASVEFPLTDDALARVEQELEGWVAGLRLVALSVRKDQHPNATLERLRGGVQHAQHYLIQEVVAAQPAKVHSWLLTSGILDRFCGSLCAAVCAEAGESATIADGESFVRTLSDENLFVIPLDTEGEWFRYHQLFQELLAAELKRTAPADRIADLHRRASEWFDSRELPDEAIKHALAAGALDRAAHVVERHAPAVMNDGRVYVAARWLALLPPAVVQERVGLLRAEAWRQYYGMENSALPTTLDRIDHLMGGDPAAHAFSADVAALRGWCALLESDGARALEYSEHALSHAGTPHDAASKSLAETVFGLAGLMQGQRERVSRSLTRWLLERSARDPRGEIDLAQTLALVSYIAADPPGAGILLDRARRVAVAAGHATLVPRGDYLDGLLHLQRGELVEALPLLGYGKQGEYLHQVRGVVDGMCAQVIGYQANGETEQAEEALRSLEEFVRDIHPSFTSLTDACAVRLALMAGRDGAASAWLRSSPPPPVEAMLWWFEVPSLTWCRALISDGTPARLREAEALLREHAAVNEAHHNTCQLIGVLCLLAVACARLGEQEEAQFTVAQAVSLAEPGGFVFPFREAGPQVAELLQGLRETHGDFVAQVLRTFDAHGVPPPAVRPADHPGEHAAGTHPRRVPAAARPMLEVLTNRELDILELLAERLQNKEIADRLSIAPETVNYHLKHIYQKLDVKSRRQAVACAIELGLLQGRA